MAHISMGFMFGLPFITVFSVGVATAGIIIVLFIWGLIYREAGE